MNHLKFLHLIKMLTKFLFYTGTILFCLGFLALPLDICLNIFLNVKINMLYFCVTPFILSFVFIIAGFKIDHNSALE